MLAASLDSSPFCFACSANHSSRTTSFLACCVSQQDALPPPAPSRGAGLLAVQDALDVLDRVGTDASLRALPRTARLAVAESSAGLRRGRGEGRRGGARRRLEAARERDRSGAAAIVVGETTPAVAAAHGAGGEREGDHPDVRAGAGQSSDSGQNHHRDQDDVASDGAVAVAKWWSVPDVLAELEDEL